MRGESQENRILPSAWYKYKKKEEIFSLCVRSLRILRVNPDIMKNSRKLANDSERGHADRSD